MNEDVIRQQVRAKYKPKATPVPANRAKLLLAQYGQTYNPDEQSTTGAPKSETPET